MSPLILAAGASFVAGLCGTILWRFAAQPLMRYRNLKGRIRQLLQAASASAAPPTAARLADELTELYHGELPIWYRQLLRNRNEDPLAAAKLLAALEAKAPAEHRLRRIEAIAAALRLGDRS